jgi:N-acetylglucosamine-6-sulfatase
MKISGRTLFFSLLLGLIFSPFSRLAVVGQPRGADPQPLVKLPDRTPRNVVFIIIDDLRYDALGFLQGQKFLETPNIDQLAKRGVHLPNAFVTTALCSPSRASILTGQYAHRHRVVDNDSPIPPGLTFFPQYLQRARYETAFIGKWHIGGQSDDPQPGFDHWVSFKGQGVYLPDKTGLNVNGKPVPQKGYITDELTEYALDWLRARRSDKPFFLYLSHKAVHAEFIPAERHRGRYAGKAFVPPATMSAENVIGAPKWVRDQRNSWHGVDFPYHSDLNIADYYRRYGETLLAVDESVGQITKLLNEKRMLDSTLIFFMGDNGFSFGEHGLIDKRTAYEESMRVPLLMHCPDLLRGGNVASEVVANIDIAPTILEAAGLKAPSDMDGQSFLSVAEGKQTSWREHLLYEYYWEWAFPQTPTIFALRGERYKYIHYYGIWDINELFDIKADPKETRNLISSAEHQEVVKQLRQQMFDLLERSGGLSIPVKPAKWGQQNLRRETGPKASDFPSELIKKR